MLLIDFTEDNEMRLPMSISARLTRGKMTKILIVSVLLVWIILAPVIGVPAPPGGDGGGDPD